MSRMSSGPKRSSLKTSSRETLSLTGILGRIRTKNRNDLREAISQILSPMMWMNLEKLVPRCPTSSHRCVPIMTQQKALTTRILKMENYEKCWLHRCIYGCERKIASGKPKAVIIQRRGASAERTQADLREGLMSCSSQEPRASGKLAAMFSSGNKEPGNLIKSSVFKHADPSNLGRSLLEGNNDHSAQSGKI